MTNRIIRLLAIISTLLTCNARAEKVSEPKAGVTVLAATEQNGLKSNHGEVILKPDIGWEKGDFKVGYYGSFYRSKESDGSEIDWLTLASKIQAENEDWTLEIGRSTTRKYAGFLYTPTTTGFDNLATVKGMARTYTGTILTHKESGVTMGQVANDTRMTPTHWDSTLLGWAGDLNNEWGIQLQVAGGRRPLTSGGLTLKWQPNRKTALVAEGFYLNREKSAILTANRKLTDDLTLFAGAQLTSPRSGKPEGLATLGMSYDIGAGFSVVIAAHQNLGSDKTTEAILGIKYWGDFRQK